MTISFGDWWVTTAKHVDGRQTWLAKDEAGAEARFFAERDAPYHVLIDLGQKALAGDPNVRIYFP